MEKIYVEEKQNKKSNVKKVMGSKVPHHFSALLILVAFATFLTIGLRDHVSHAITVEELGDEIETVTVRDDNTPYREVIAKVPDTGAEIPEFVVPYNFVNNASRTQVFCLDKKGEIITEGYKFKRNSSEVDDGIIFIMMQKKVLDGAEEFKNLKDTTRTWFIQQAIWLYEARKGMPEKPTETVEELETKLKSAVTIKSKKALAMGDSTESETEGTDEFPVATYGENYLYNVVNEIVTEAMSAPSTKLNVTKSGDNMTVTSDNKYYKTPMITIDGLVSGSSYNLEIKNAPAGTKVYLKDGTEITNNLSSITSDNNQFYLLVPIANVTEKTKTTTISVTGSQQTAYRYDPYDESGQVATDIQPIAVLTDANVMKGLELTYSPSVPDTSMSAAQSIYFIGLVILLCGLGIIYANAKPKVTEE